MKVLLFNGSPKVKGNSFHALELLEKDFKETDIDAEIIQIGKLNLKGCLGCGSCFKTRNDRCIIDDELNELVPKIKEADGYIFASPVYFAGMTPQLKAFMDRLFYLSGANGNYFYHKVAASVVAVRRSGGSATFDDINKFLLYSEMIIPTSNYWNIIHGTVPGEVLKDAEGIQILDRLAKNMSWTLQIVDNARGNKEIIEPKKDKKVFTNFIR